MKTNIRLTEVDERKKLAKHVAYNSAQFLPMSQSSNPAISQQAELAKLNSDIAKLTSERSVVAKNLAVATANNDKEAQKKLTSDFGKIRANMKKLVADREQIEAIIKAMTTKWDKKYLDKYLKYKAKYLELKNSKF